MNISDNMPRRVLVLLLAFQLSYAPLLAQTTVVGGAAAGGGATTEAKTAAGAPAGQSSVSTSAVNELDELLGAGTYALFVEMRLDELSAQAQQNADLFAVFAPLFKREQFQMPKTLMDFSRKYEAEMRQEGARLIFAAVALQSDLPQLLAAVRLSSPEVASTFEADVRNLISSLKDELAKASQKPSSSKATRRTRKRGTPTKAAPPSSSPLPADLLATLDVTIARRGNLVILSEKPFDLVRLRNAGSPLFVADERVSRARERFAKDGVIYFVDVAGLIEGVPRLLKALDTLTAQTAASASGPRSTGTDENTTATASTSPPASFSSLISPEMLQRILDGLGDNLPSAMAAGAKFEGGDYVAKALIMPRPGQTVGLTPLIPIPVMGPALRMRVPEMLPSDVEVAGSLSLDYQKSYDKALEIYRAFTKLRSGAGGGTTSTQPDAPTVEAQIGEVEEQLGFKIRDELLASFGHEVGFAIKVGSYPWETAPLAAGGARTPTPSTGEYSLAILMEVKDRERIEKILPQVLGAVQGLAGVSASAATPVKEQVSAITINIYGKTAYAFVGDFLVLADRPEMISRIIEAKENGAQGALANDANYRASMGEEESLTRFYVAKDVMRSLDATFQKSLAALQPKSGTTADAEMIKVLSSISREARPLTYQITRDPAGVYHEMRIPTGWYTLFVAYALTEGAKSKSTSTPPKKKAKARPKAKASA